jgi:hypothetical protein
MIMVMERLKELSRSLSIYFNGEEAKFTAESIRRELMMDFSVDMDWPKPVPPGTSLANGEVAVILVFTPLMEKLWRAVTYSIKNGLSGSHERKRGAQLILKESEGDPGVRFSFLEPSDLEDLIDLIEFHVRKMRKYQPNGESAR